MKIHAWIWSDWYMSWYTNYIPTSIACLNVVNAFSFISSINDKYYF